MLCANSARALILALLAVVMATDAASIWVIYRVIRGYLLFKESKPLPGT